MQTKRFSKNDNLIAFKIKIGMPVFSVFLLIFLVFSVQAGKRPQDDPTDDSNGSGNSSFSGSHKVISESPKEFATSDDFESSREKNEDLKQFLKGYEVQQEITVKNPSERKFFTLTSKNGKI